MLGAGRREASLLLPFAAWGLPRATLDAALLEAARGCGAEIRCGTAVRDVGAEGDTWRLRLADGEAMRTGALVLATGKHELRGMRRAASGGAIGVKLPLSGTPPEGAILLLACAGGYAGLQPRPGGGANLCAALDPRAPGVAEAARCASGFIAHVAAGSTLAERALRDLRPAVGRPMTVAGVPYGYVHRGGGPLRVGDQLSVIPSFCGDGVAMALCSGLRAADALRRGEAGAAHHARWAAEVRGGMRLAGWLATLTGRAPWLLIGGAALAP
ncbi:NAD(P)/FAD-dependent oxidoreductase, partial [Falsiroseomonas oryziterrae]|uniref:NAD(P)/FAD-dependent oxidoreductase n=1 Tax=Falsiroseomonas oryziterrae TaxID=2911368 RepID=UPI001F3BFFEC